MKKINWKDLTLYRPMVCNKCCAFLGFFDSNIPADKNLDKEYWECKCKNKYSIVDSLRRAEFRIKKYIGGS